MVSHINARLINLHEQVLQKYTKASKCWCIQVKHILVCPNWKVENNLPKAGEGIKQRSINFWGRFIKGRITVNISYSIRFTRLCNNHETTELTEVRLDNVRRNIIWLWPMLPRDYFRTSYVNWAVQYVAGILLLCKRRQTTQDDKVPVKWQ